MSYQTRDSETASVLASQKQRFKSEKKGSEVWFVFEDEAMCKSIMISHSNRDLIVSSLDLTSAIHEIKKIIINQTQK